MARAVAAELLIAMRPIGVEAALDAWDRRQESEDQKVRAIQMALDKCRYEADGPMPRYVLPINTSPLSP
jgi:hypothetical protein